MGLYRFIKPLQRDFKDRYLKLQRRDWQAAVQKIQLLIEEPLNV